MTVSFDTNIRELPWEFSSQQIKVKVHPGELGEASFLVVNKSQHDIIGRAISTGSYCNSSLARKSVFALPAKYRVSHNFGRCALAGSSLDKWLDKHFKYYPNMAGTVLIFDPGCGMHQGGIVQSGQRVALQVLMK